jgi:hypothetical protein
LKLKIGDTLIIPKNPVENIQDLQSELKQIAQRFEIGYTTDLNWSGKPHSMIIFQTLPKA